MNYNFVHTQAQNKEFLKFADYNKTVSYVYSFGITNIDYEWKNKIVDGINHIKYL